MENEYAIEIERPRQDVFDFLDDEANLKMIVPNLADFGTIEDKPGVVGSTFWHVYEENGRKMKMKGVVTEYAPPERKSVSVDGALFGLKVTYVLDELGPTKTRLTQISNARFKHVFKLMGLMFRKKMEREGLKVQKDTFARIKAHLEQGAAE